MLTYKIKKNIRQMTVGTFLESTARSVNKILLLLNFKVGWTPEDILTQEIMKRALKEDSNCIDVGCHKGDILKMMLRFAPNGNHFAFEPIPELYTALTTSFGHLGNIHFYDNALSDVKEETSFQHVISNPGFSGLRKRKYDHDDEKIQEITVKTDLLDNIIPEHITIDLIKIDVEGAELQVFRGAMKTIQRCKPLIIFEHKIGAADYYGTRSEDVYKLLSVQCRLKLSLLNAWLENGGTESLSIEAFCEEFASDKNWYFIAYP
jgi:FkbM family methyltransferase